MAEDEAAKDRKMGGPDLSQGTIARLGITNFMS